MRLLIRHIYVVRTHRCDHRTLSFSVASCCFFQEKKRVYSKAYHAMEKTRLNDGDDEETAKAIHILRTCVFHFKNMCANAVCMHI